MSPNSLKTVYSEYKENAKKDHPLTTEPRKNKRLKTQSSRPREHKPRAT